MTEYTFNFHKLTRKQLDVFEQVAIGNDAAHNLRMLDSLVNKGLIERYEEKGFEKVGGAFFPAVTYRYRVPIAIHAAWCAWCAAHVDDYV